MIRQHLVAYSPASTNRNKENKCNEYSDLTISLEGTSEFPGQTGGNNNNFHFEDILSKITHISVGLLKEKVQND